MSDDLLARALDRHAPLSPGDLTALAADPELRARLATLLAFDDDLDRVLSPERADFANRMQRVVNRPKTNRFRREVASRARRQSPWRRYLPVGLGLAASFMVALLVWLRPGPSAIRAWSPTATEQVTLAQGQRLTFAAGARAHLAEHDMLVLETGTVTAEVPPNARGWQVQTAHTVITVHGTRFQVVVSAERTLVFLQHGNVQIVNPRGSLDLAPGEQAEVGLDMPPRLVPPRLVTPRLVTPNDPDPKAPILSHPGADGPVDLPMSPELAHLEDHDYTLAVWYRGRAWPSPFAPDVTDYAAILVRFGWTCGLLQNSDGRIIAQYFLADRTPVGRAARQSLPTGSWHHLAQVVSPERGSLRFYIDGRLEADNTWKPGAAHFDHGDEPWRIGHSSPGTWEAQGSTRQVRIYARALSDEEISELARDAPP